jgi:hypothetical protein
MTDRELMQMALLKMEYMLNNGEWYKPEETIEALRARLAQPEQAPTNNGRYLTGYKAQPEQEPVAWMYEFYADRGYPGLAFEPQRSADNVPLYTAPSQREWQGLTDEEITGMTENGSQLMQDYAIKVARAIEAKLKEKNT